MNNNEFLNFPTTNLPSNYKNLIDQLKKLETNTLERNFFDIKEYKKFIEKTKKGFINDIKNIVQKIFPKENLDILENPLFFHFIILKLFIILRHGENIFKDTGEKGGLSERGKKQIEKVANNLNKFLFLEKPTIFHGPSERTTQTAKIIQQKLPKSKLVQTKKLQSRNGKKGFHLANADISALEAKKFFYNLLFGKNDINIIITHKTNIGGILSFITQHNLSLDGKTSANIEFPYTQLDYGKYAILNINGLGKLLSIGENFPIPLEKLHLLENDQLNIFLISLLTNIELQRDIIMNHHYLNNPSRKNYIKYLQKNFQNLRQKIKKILSIDELSLIEKMNILNFLFIKHKLFPVYLHNDREEIKISTESKSFLEKISELFLRNIINNYFPHIDKEIVEKLTNSYKNFFVKNIETEIKNLLKKEENKDLLNQKVMSLLLFNTNYNNADDLLNKIKQFKKNVHENQDIIVYISLSELLIHLSDFLNIIKNKYPSTKENKLLKEITKKIYDFLLEIENKIDKDNDNIFLDLNLLPLERNPWVIYNKYGKERIIKKI